MRDKLTSKQEGYAQDRASGLAQSAAYCNPLVIGHCPRYRISHAFDSSWPPEIGFYKNVTCAKARLGGAPRPAACGLPFSQRGRV